MPGRSQGDLSTSGRLHMIFWMETKDEPFLSDSKESWEKQNKWLKDKGMTKETVPADELFENILK